MMRFASWLGVACLAICLTARAAETEPKPTGTPSAREILERFGKATGADALKKHKSQHSTGSVQMPAQGMDGKLEVFAMRPNKMVIKMNLSGIELNTGFDGKNGWIHSALTGAMLLEGKMLEQVAGQADFDQAMHRPEDYKTMEVLGTEAFDGEDCYKLKLVRKNGFESTEYFSKKTGLQKGFIATQESPLGTVTATTVVTDYKKFGELTLPSRVSQKAAGVETVMTFDSITFDSVDPKVFEAPAEVKAAIARGSDQPATEKKQNEK